MVEETATSEAGEAIPVRDERGRLDAAFVAKVESAVAAGDEALVRRLAGSLHEADVGDLIEVLDPGARSRFVRLLGDKFDFAALTELDETIRSQILDELSPTAVAEGVRELESDDAVSILEDLPAEERAEILAQIPPVERVALARGLEYPEDSAGRLMQTDLIAVPPGRTVGQVIDLMREAEDLPEEFYQLFVVDAGHRLIGTVALDRLLRSKRPTTIATITDANARRVRATDDQEDVARLFERYNLVSVAVVDEAERLVGVITVDDVVDVIEEEAEEDIRFLGGVGQEEVSDSVWMITRGRFAWLSVNLLTALLASAVIGLFESELQKMVALAVLMPIVASQGGNAGTQTMTVVVRALATRDIGRHNALRIIGRELVVGFLNGVGFAIIVGVIAIAWFKVTDLGVVMGIAMLANLIAAALGGVLIPLGLYAIRIDPAVASGAFVTTVTDVVGFFSFLALATFWFGLR